MTSVSARLKVGLNICPSEQVERLTERIIRSTSPNLLPYSLYSCLSPTKSFSNLSERRENMPIHAAHLHCKRDVHQTVSITGLL